MCLVSRRNEKVIILMTVFNGSWTFGGFQLLRSNNFGQFGFSRYVELRSNSWKRENSYPKLSDSLLFLLQVIDLAPQSIIDYRFINIFMHRISVHTKGSMRF